jgi:RNA polymerase sigma factor (sigma-70 family)
MTLLFPSLNKGLENQPDAHLIGLAVQGDRTAFSELWTRHVHSVTVAVWTLARGNREDVVSETFSVIWAQLQDGHTPISNFRAYACATARNIASCWYKDSRRRRELQTFCITSEASTEITELAEQQEEVALAFAVLPVHQQELLWLIEVDQLPRREVARRLQIAPNAVAAGTRRARESLRAAWLEQQLPKHAEHPEIAAALPQFVRGKLGRKQSKAVQKHLDNCPACSAILVDLKDNNRLVGRASSSALILTGTGTVVGALQAVGGASSASAATLASVSDGGKQIAFQFAAAKAQSAQTSGAPSGLFTVGAVKTGLSKAAATVKIGSLGGASGSTSLALSGVIAAAVLVVGVSAVAPQILEADKPNSGVASGGESGSSNQIEFDRNSAAVSSGNLFTENGSSQGSAGDAGRSGEDTSASQKKSDSKHHPDQQAQASLQSGTGRAPDGASPRSISAPDPEIVEPGLTRYEFYRLSASSKSSDSATADKSDASSNSEHQSDPSGSVGDKTPDDPPASDEDDKGESDNSDSDESTGDDSSDSDADNDGDADSDSDADSDRNAHDNDNEGSGTETPCAVSAGNASGSGSSASAENREHC